MAEEWQEAAFSNRHVHNRIRGGRNQGRKARPGAVFDVRKTFGTYDLKCPAAEKTTVAHDGADHDPANSRLELYRLNERGDAVLGELSLSTVLHGVVILAGGRKVINSVIASLSQEAEASDVEDGEANAPRAHTQNDRNGSEGEADVLNDAESDSSDEDDNEDASNRRFKTFEKNSFRSPKFWLRWQGSIPSQSPEAGTNSVTTGSGYIVFAGNDCSKFQGTISCEELGWDNVKISGRKEATRSTRDTEISWQLS